MVLGKIVRKDSEPIISNQMKTYNIFDWYKKVQFVDGLQYNIIPLGAKVLQVNFEIFDRQWIIYWLELIS